MRQEICLAAFLLSAVLCLAAICHVPGDFVSIQAALNVCTSGDSILVAEGVYHENLVWPQIDGISLIGVDRLTTIVDGSANGRVLVFQGSMHDPVITVATKVSNLTLRNGYSPLNGVGVSCYYASPDISECIIAHNSAPDWSSCSGGGVYCYFSNAHFTDVIIAENSAYSGGGVYIYPVSSPIFTDCVIADNTLISPNGSYAAGIFARFKAWPEFIGCTITRNRYFNASAIQLAEVSYPTFINCTVTDNEFGFRLVSDGILTATHCNIMGNSQAGMVNVGSGSPYVQSNWWGDSSGPEHVDNPAGTGDLIVGNANFTPWLSAHNPLAPPPPPRNLSAIVQGTELLLSWDPVVMGDDIMVYAVHIGTDSLQVIQPFCFYTALSMVGVGPMSPDADYYIQVKAAYNYGIWGWFSETLRVHTGGSPNDDPGEVPAPLLLSVQPNPFSQSTRIKYRLDKPGLASLRVYNLRGQFVVELFSAKQNSGVHELVWNGRDATGKRLSSGVYLLEIRHGERSKHCKILLSNRLS